MRDFGDLKLLRSIDTDGTTIINGTFYHKECWGCWDSLDQWYFWTEWLPVVWSAMSKESQWSRTSAIVTPRMAVVVGIWLLQEPCRTFIKIGTPGTVTVVTAGLWLLLKPMWLLDCCEMGLIGLHSVLGKQWLAFGLQRLSGLVELSDCFDHWDHWFLWTTGTTGS